MMVFDLVLCFSFDAFFVYVSRVFEDINPRKQKLVWYALDGDKVEFDLSQDPERHAFLCVKVGVSFKILFYFIYLFIFFCVFLKACVVRNMYLVFLVLT